MATDMNRRKFLGESALLTGGVASAAGLVAAGEHDALPGEKSSGEKQSVENPFFRLDYDLGTGKMSLWDQEGVPLFLNVVSAAHLPRSFVVSSDANYSCRARSSAIRDKLGAGRQLIVECKDAQRQLDLEQRATLYDGSRTLVFETIAKNVSETDIVVPALEPLRALLDDHAGCFFGGQDMYSAVTKVLTHGYLYYDPGSLLELRWLAHKRVESLWNIAFHIPSNGETLVVGFLGGDRGEGVISAGMDLSREWYKGRAGFNLSAQSRTNRDFVLRPGQSASSGKLMVHLSHDPFQALEYYAESFGRLHDVKLNNVVTGWCSWFYTRGLGTEDEQLKNAKFIARHLKPLGMEYVQIDDGYQRAFGDWEPTDRYPHGMKWLASQIRELGLKPGIWVAPYAIAEDTDIARNHPEWLVHRKEGELQDMTDYCKYALDITHPEARQWLFDLLDRIANDWGYELIKIDFVEWTLMAAQRYYDPTFSKTQAYRLGFETMRRAVGPNCHLLDCGPAPASVGLADSTRIELDMPSLSLSWEQYAEHFNSNAPAIAKRYYFHKRTWINDPDHLGLARLTLPQARAAASVIALSGGTMISADRLYELDSARLEILKKVVPSYGEAARPIDLFEREYPEVFALSIEKDFGNWLVVGVFNWDERATLSQKVKLQSLGLEPEKEYLVYEFWTQTLVGKARGEINLTLEPSSVQLLAIHPRRGVPQLISTDRHFSQGGLELAEVSWDKSTQTLRGASLGPPGSEHRLAIYVPDGYEWSDRGPRNYHDFGEYSAVLSDPHLLHVHLKFADEARVGWNLKFGHRS